MQNKVCEEYDNGQMGWVVSTRMRKGFKMKGVINITRCLYRHQPEFCQEPIGGKNKGEAHLSVIFRVPGDFSFELAALNPPCIYP